MTINDVTVPKWATHFIGIWGFPNEEHTLKYYTIPIELLEWALSSTKNGNLKTKFIWFIKLKSKN